MKKELKLFTASLLSVLLLSGCAAKGSADEGNTIKIGLNYELSGNVSTYGTSLVDGIEFAVKEINADGGVLGKQIELVKADNKSSGEEAANVSSRLATRDKVVAILGPATSGNVKSALPAAEENKVPLISASSTADDVTLNAQGGVRQYVFKTCFSDSFQGVTMANFAAKELKFMKAAILRDNTSDYSQGLTDAFTETYTSYGGVIVKEEAYQAKETDFKSLLTNIKAANPDVLFVPGYY